MSRKNCRSSKEVYKYWIFCIINNLVKDDRLSKSKIIISTWHNILSFEDSEDLFVKWLWYLQRYLCFLFFLLSGSIFSFFITLAQIISTIQKKARVREREIGTICKERTLVYLDSYLVFSDRLNIDSITTVCFMLNISFLFHLIKTQKMTDVYCRKIVLIKSSVSNHIPPSR